MAHNGDCRAVLVLCLERICFVMSFITWNVMLLRAYFRGLMEHLDLPKELARQCLDRMADEGHLVKVRIGLSLPRKGSI